ncbi:MAG TPA: hypothetical protein VF283_12720 [Bryobacteraceae bacterium]
MAEDPNEIEHNIESRRRDLGGHLDELETRLREETNWRTYVRRNPLTVLATVFGAGLMLAYTFGGRR